MRGDGGAVGRSAVHPVLSARRGKGLQPSALALRRRRRSSARRGMPQGSGLVAAPAARVRHSAQRRRRGVSFTVAKDRTAAQPTRAPFVERPCTRPRLDERTQAAPVGARGPRPSPSGISGTRSNEAKRRLSCAVAIARHAPSAGGVVADKPLGARPSLSAAGARPSFELHELRRRARRRASPCSGVRHPSSFAVFSQRPAADRRCGSPGPAVRRRRHVSPVIIPRVPRISGLGSRVSDLRSRVSGGGPGCLPGLSFPPKATPGGGELLTQLACFLRSAHVRSPLSSHPIPTTVSKLNEGVRCPGTGQGPTTRAPRPGPPRLGRSRPPRPCYSPPRDERGGFC